MAPGSTGLSAKTIRAAARGVAAAAADRPHRPLLRAPRRPEDAARGDARRLRRARERGQGPLHRRLELHGAAAGRGAGHLRARGPRALRRPAAALQPRRPRGLRGRPAADLRKREGLACVPYFALAQGFLTGKYRPGGDVKSARAEGARRYLARAGMRCSRRSTRSPRPTHDGRGRRRSPGCAAQPTVARRSPARGRRSSSRSSCQSSGSSCRWKSAPV